VPIVGSTSELVAASKAAGILSSVTGVAGQPSSPTGASATSTAVAAAPTTQAAGNRLANGFTPSSKKSVAGP